MAYAKFYCDPQIFILKVTMAVLKINSIVENISDIVPWHQFIRLSNLQSSQASLLIKDMYISL